jgi:hypothetical protein
MDRLYENWAKKNITTNLTLDDYGKVVKEIEDIVRSAKELGEELSDAQKKYIGYRASQIKQFESQQGGMESVSPTQQAKTSTSIEDEEVSVARRIIARNPQRKDEINRRLISAGKSPIE